jgi:DnaJ family protein B protein 12
MDTSDEDLISGVNGASSHYSVLHIAHEARYEDVKRAYRQLALRLHPDKCRAEGAEDAFKRVGQAFHVLGDDKRRRLYDLQGEDAPAGQDANRESDSTDPMDIFRDLFGGANPGVKPTNRHQLTNSQQAFTL